MYRFSDSDCINLVKEFSYLLFEEADFESALSYYTDDINYYNSMGAISIQGKKKLKKFFKIRQEQNPHLYSVIFHKISVQKINTTNAVVQLLGELKGCFHVNSVVTLRIVNGELKISHIHGFFSKIEHSGTLSEKAKNEVHSLYENIPDMMVCASLDDAGTISYANNNFYKTVGYSREEFEQELNNSLDSIIIPSSFYKNYRDFAQFLLNSAKNTQTLEFSIRTKSGEIKNIITRNCLVFDESGQAFCYSIGTDALKIAEYKESVYFQQRKLQTAILQANLVYWELNLQTKQCELFMNYKGKLKNFSYEDFVKDIFELGIVHPDYKEDFEELHRKVFSGVPYAEANILSKLDNFYVWRLLKYTVMYDADGKPLLAIGTSEDNNFQREMETQLMLAGKQAGLVVFKYDINTKIVQLSLGHDSTYSYDEVEYNVPESRIQAGLVHPDDVEAYRDIYNRMALGDERNLTLDLRLKNKNQTAYCWSRLSFSVITDELGYPMYGIGTLIDITKEKQLEFEYKHYLEEWEVEHDNVWAKYVLNFSKGIVVQAQKSHAFDIQSFNGKTIKEFLDTIEPYIQIDKYKELFRVTYNTKKIISEYHSGKRKFNVDFPVVLDGMFYWTRTTVNLYADPLTNDIQSFISIYDITHDIVNTTYTEQYLYEQVDFFIKLNTETNKYSIFLSSTTQEEIDALNLTGGFKSDVQLFVDKYVHTDDKVMVLNELSPNVILENLKKQDSYDIIARIVRNSTHETRYKRMQFYPDTILPFVINIAISDISDIYAEEMRKNEVLSQALQTAKQASQIKSTFLASMSHDLRTPMNAILGMTTLALDDLTNAKQVKESFEIIKSSSEHLLELLNDILEMNRIESGKDFGHKLPFSIVEECTNICEMFKTSISTKNMHFSLDMSSVKQSIVIGDKTKFNRIISNLIGNAVKYTPENGSISVEVQEKESLSKSVSYFSFVIKDTGIGIAKENIPYIFDPFHRENTGKVKRIEGLGLGLAIVKAFVDNTGGTISVDSELGKGSTFTVELPYTVSEVSVSRKVSDSIRLEDIDLSGISILLAEDNEINALMFSKLLKKCGSNVTIAKNGQEAVEKFWFEGSLNKYQLIFMDIQMPVMDGIEATKKIRQSDNMLGKVVPIIAVTANAFQDDIKACIDAGMNAHISKPIRLNELASILTSFVKDYRLNSPTSYLQNVTKKGE